jgi:uncharacterized membrane protein YfcA
MHEGWQFWTIGAIAAMLVGIAKTGVPGMGVLVVPVIAMIFPARTSVGALLPMLLAGDMAAVLFFRRHANWPLLWRLFPWTFAGIAAAAILLKFISDGVLKPLLGVIVLVLLALEIARKKSAWLSRPHQKGFTEIAGVLTGFATTVGNVAGPIANVFLIGKGFAKKEFMGTVAWYFLIINASKVPIFWANRMITAETLRFNLILLPALAIGGVTGRIILHRVSDRVFQMLILILSAAAAIKLLWDGIAHR